MDDINNTKSNTVDIIDAVSNLNKTIPIYKDGLQPAVKEIGKSLKTVAQVLNIALLPLDGLIWGQDKIKNFILQDVATKIKNIPKKDRIDPKPEIIVPALQTASYRGYDTDIKEILASLIATSMDKNYIKYAHPSFVSIINQLCSDEVKILKLLSKKFYISWKNIKINELPNNKIIKNKVVKKLPYRGLDFVLKYGKIDYPDLFDSYIENLVRLNLLDYPRDYYENKHRYDDKIIHHYDSGREDYPFDKTSNKIISKILSCNEIYKDDIQSWIRGDGAIVKINSESLEKKRYLGEFSFLFYIQDTITVNSYGKKFLTACFKERNKGDK